MPKLNFKNLFGNNKNNSQQIVTDFDIGLSEDASQIKRDGFEKNIRTIKDIIAPSEINVINSDTVKIGNRYMRNFIMQGYPNIAHVGWLDALYLYNGDLDTAVMVEPTENSMAVSELSNQITALEAQRLQEIKAGKTANIMNYEAQIVELQNQRHLIERNVESMYNIGIFANMFANSEEQLNKQTEYLQASLQGQRITFLSTDSRMLNGFKTALPLNYNFFGDKLRNFSTGALVACMPFVRGELYHPDGVYIGRNIYTGNKVMLNMYNKEFANNTNMSVFGRAGSGKTYFMSLLAMRYAIKGLQTIFVDPEGEYYGLTSLCGGINIKIGIDSPAMLNTFEIEEEQETDDEGNLTGRTIVNLADKYDDIISLISVMAKEIDQEQKSLISSVVVSLYRNFGITTDPRSLYIDDAMTQKKRLPQFTDFYNLLGEKIAEKEQDNPMDQEIIPLKTMQNKLKMFKQGEAYPLFDCQSTVKTSYFANAPIINFDVSPLGESTTLRPIGMYVALTYIWEKIVKKNYKILKRVVCDEAWMMVSRTQPGYQFTAGFLNNLARRIRKRRAGLIVSSQNFVEFTTSEEGKAVLSNTAVRVFLKQNEIDIDALQDAFKISNGERDFLLRAKTGQALLKTDTDTVAIEIKAFPFENEFIQKSKVA